MQRESAERQVQTGVQKASAERQVQTGNQRRTQTRSVASDHVRIGLRAFRLAKVLRQSFVGLWVAGLWAWAWACVCVCVCVYVCVFGAARVQKGSQNKPDGSTVEAFSTHFGPGRHQRQSENQQKNRNLQKIANTKTDNYKNVIVQTRRGFLSKNRRPNGCRITIVF